MRSGLPVPPLLVPALLLAAAAFAAPSGDPDLSPEERAMLEAVRKEMQQQHDAAVKEAVAVFKTAIRAKSIGERVEAVRAIDAAERDAKIIPELARLVSDSESVRIAVMEALGRYRRDKAAAQALLRMLPLHVRSVSMLTRNLDALGGVGHESIVPAVARFVTEKEVRVAVAAIRALGETNTPAPIPLLLGIWEELEKDKSKDGDIKKAAEERLNEVGDPLAEALAKLTGERHATAADCRAWFLRNRAKLRPKAEPPPPLCPHFDPAAWPGRVLPTGCILREVWTGIGGGSMNDLRKEGRMEKPPSQREWLARLDGPRDAANDYGTRIRGYVHPPVDGDYTFWIASDDDSELWLSPDAFPGNKVLIAKRDGATGWCNWNAGPEQQSKPIRLAAGKRYYIEVLHKEGGGGDHIAVAWQPPGGAQLVIPGARLSPFVAVTEKLEDVVAALGEMPGPGAAPKPPPKADPGAPAAPSGGATGGLVAHWPLDDGDGAALAAEATGRAPAGAVRGKPAWPSGVDGRSLDVDGPEQYVEIPPSAPLNDVNKGSYSLAAWYRPGSLPTGQKPDEEHGIVIKAGYHTGLTFTAGSRFKASHWGADNGQHTCESPDVSPASFHHVAMTVDKPAGLLRLYVDGKRAAEKRWEEDAEARDYGSVPWYIGIADPKNGAWRWAGRGRVDDVRIYAHALTAGEVKALYEGAAGAAVEKLPDKPEKLLRAVNFNGPAVAVDGVPWESSEGVENCLIGGRPYAKAAGPLEPAAGGAKGWMLRTGYTSTGSMPILIGGVKAGTYKVFLFVWEDDAAVTYGVKSGDRELVTGRTSGAAGHWEKVELTVAQAQDGALRLRITGGAVHVAGIEVWRD